MTKQVITQKFGGQTIELSSIQLAHQFTPNRKAMWLMAFVSYYEEGKEPTNG